MAFNLDEKHIYIYVSEYMKYYSDELELDAKDISWEEFIKTIIQKEKFINNLSKKFKFNEYFLNNIDFEFNTLTITRDEFNFTDWLLPVKIQIPSCKVPKTNELVKTKVEVKFRIKNIRLTD
ncbi:hypothetical protein [Mycoplasmopsis glycophila]|uniref:Uncharacterized protein n=1 Tax=Mycoplasmopsis glycophila TaxID=171285 RepID=A0A449AWW8_9BACT|nr:hypothetical protein [Mycoplasmopsis glycophila]VEU71282.1 Uncharacterised protein [Mycoplasmopsis glycophila]